ncbi:hypothetical protein LINPERPRIM_LOCUS36789 [Linum perenne]
MDNKCSHRNHCHQLRRPLPRLVHRSARLDH